MEQILGESALALFLGLLLCDPLAGSFVDAAGALVFLGFFRDQTAGHEVLEFFVSAETEHFLAAADGVAEFQILKDAFEKIVETKLSVVR